MNPQRAKNKPIILFDPYISKNAQVLARSVLKNGLMKYGILVRHFESQVSKRFGFNQPIAVGSGTAAIQLAIRAANIGKGDEVITTPMTCVASNIPILLEGAKPIFADIQFDSGNIDPEDISHRVTKRTKAILCVHLAGYPCDMDKIESIAKKHNLVVIEDAGQAMMAKYQGNVVGKSANYACFSFGRSKQVASLEGGLLVINDPKGRTDALRLRYYGFDPDDLSPNLSQPPSALKIAGNKFDMNNVSAAVALGNLDELDGILKRRQEIADTYRKELRKVPGITFFQKKKDRKSANWVFMLHVDHRSEFTRKLAEKNIQSWIIFLRNDHYELFGCRENNLPVLDRFEKSYTALPCHNKMTDKDLEMVIKTIRSGW